MAERRRLDLYSDLIRQDKISFNTVDLTTLDLYLELPPWWGHWQWVGWKNPPDLPDSIFDVYDGAFTFLFLIRRRISQLPFTCNDSARIYRKRRVGWIFYFKPKYATRRRARFLYTNAGNTVLSKRPRRGFYTGFMFEQILSFHNESVRTVPFWGEAFGRLGKDDFGSMFL